ncbi:hypothetical protein BFP71_13115 [Roseivirga misakiensis]|uniref:Uncharacterized protein n=1 Tax=Roseivirga misakiensis TaxID=1563681 RepID=A0A1E5T2H5_9BACT|nr:hypothetical protein BFP71_13115 [Roseivirga misakiensis]
MRRNTFLIILFFASTIIFAQDYSAYVVSEKNPFGLPNPKAPSQIKDYADLIGTCDCQSTSRNQDQTWAEPIAMTWTFKYIMNGMAVQDETIKADGSHSGSIRQYNADSARWHVHYYATSGTPATLPSWEGGLKKEENKIVLYRDSPAPNGTPGNYRITFSEMSKTGFNWIGEWVDKDETISFPLWKITCKKRNP